MGARSRAQELNELKQILRALVESYGNHIAIRSLSRVYRQSEGHDIPFGRFGVDNEFELIQEMDDTFGIEVSDKHRDYSDYLVYCRSDPNTQHIVDFVANQRHDDNEDKELLTPFPKVFKSKPNVKQRAFSLKPFSLKATDACVEETDDTEEMDIDLIESMRAANWRPRPKSAPKRTPVCPLPDSTVISNDEKTRIHSLLSRHKCIYLSNFAFLYRSLHGCAIDFKRFGSLTLEQFLKRMPQLVRLDATLDGYIVSLVQPIIGSDEQTNTCHDTQHNGLNGSHETHDKRNTVTTDDNGNANHLNDGLVATQEFIGHKEISRFRQILSRYPNGILPKDFIKEYYRIFKEPIIPAKLGYCSVIEMFASITQLFYLQKPANGSQNCDEYLLLKTTPELRAQTTATFPKRRAFDKKFKERALDVILRVNGCDDTNADHCLYVHEFAEAYELMFSEVIEPNVYGFKNFKDLLMALSRECDIDMKERMKNKPYLVYKKKF